MEDSKIVWDLPSESAVIDRIAELQEFIKNFPESRLVPVFENAIAELNDKL